MALEAKEPDFRELLPNPDFQLTRIAAVAPHNATLKGILLDDVLAQAPDRAEVLRRAGASDLRIGAFANVPYLTYLKVVSEVAQMKRPGAPIGATIREMARGYYPRFRDTIPGKTIFGVFGSDARRILAQGHRGWSMLLNFGQYSVSVLAPTHLRYRFAEYPAAMVEASDSGVLLGAMDVLGVKGRLRIARVDERHAEIDIAW